MPTGNKENFDSRSHHSNYSKLASFTLIELLIVIGVLATLSTASVLMLNPVEMLKQSRDTMRFNDLGSLNNALMLFQMASSAPIGTNQTVYISLPDLDNALPKDCAEYTLPVLPAGWSYSCALLSDYRKVDGNGWIPVDFGQISNGSPLASLPVDPINDIQGNFYYAYTIGGSWELNATVEASKNNLGGGNDRVSTDGGDDFTKYEVGTNLTLAPWSFEFKYFEPAANNSDRRGWYKFTGTGTVTAGSDAQTPNFITANGYVWYVWQENMPFNPDSTYKISCRSRQTIDPTSGGKGIYCGWAGVAGDKTTLVNYTGTNTYSSQHYHAVAGNSLVSGAGWSTFTGYTKGWGSPNGNSGTCSSPATPCKMHQSVSYIRPLFIMNYPSGNGSADMDYIQITKQ